MQAGGAGRGPPVSGQDGGADGLDGRPVRAVAAFRQGPARRLALPFLAVLPTNPAPSPTQPFQTSEYLPIGGIEQWVSTRGSDPGNPVLLIVHGGPGYSNASVTHAFDSWQQDFTIVDWDQRGAGRTFMHNGLDGSRHISLDRIARDGVELARLLRERFEQQQITVVGLSFGSVIALKMVTLDPSRFEAYIGSGQLVSGPDGDALGFRETLKEARRTNNREAMDALEEIGPPPWRDAQTWFLAKSWAGRLTRPEDPASKIRLDELLEGLLKRGYSREELEGIRRGAALTTYRLAPHTANFDARRFAARVEVPVYLFQGENDLNAATGLAVEWFDAVQAPRKVLRIVPGGSHGAFYASSDEFRAFVLEVMDPKQRTSHP